MVFTVWKRKYCAPDFSRPVEDEETKVEFTGVAALATFIQLKLQEGYDLQTSSCPLEDCLIFDRRTNTTEIEYWAHKN